MGDASKNRKLGDLSKNKFPGLKLGKMNTLDFPSVVSQEQS
jgi:hypothetical protein